MNGSPSDDERVLYCTDLDKEPGFPGCCDSCHEDDVEGWAQLCGEHYDGDRLTHLVCCRVSTWLDQRNAVSAGDQHGK